VDRATDF